MRTESYKDRIIERHFEIEGSENCCDKHCYINKDIQVARWTMRQYTIWSFMRTVGSIQ